MSQFYPARTDFVLDRLKLGPTGKSILDIGFIGGYAEATVHYAIVDSLGPADRLIGIDIDADRLANFLANEKTAQRQARFDLQYEVMSIFNTSFAAGEIDVVLLLEVFEHLPTPYRALDEIVRILKPGGSLVMTYPNPLSLPLALRYLLRNDLLDSGWLRAFRGAPDHRIFPHPVCLVNYLTDIGFEVNSLAFIKYAYPRLGFLNRILPHFVVTRKFSNYIGIHTYKRG